MEPTTITLNDEQAREVAALITLVATDGPSFVSITQQGDMSVIVGFSTGGTNAATYEVSAAGTVLDA